ncbi:MAG: hypothetical protein WC717_02395 [Candidatus Micrarchaeia archaeon]|jgi:hypothetical protein
MENKSTIPFLLPILLVCAAIAVAYYFLPSLGATGLEGQAGSVISLELSGRQPYVAGRMASARAISSCGAFVLSLDGKKIGEGGAYASVPVELEQGSHALLAQGNGCSASMPFSVLPRECLGNETMECSAGGCPGTRKCDDGAFSPCMLPKKVCWPGEEIGCSTDGCSFGHATCNRCGTAFGRCAPDSEKENSSAANCS